MSVASYLAKRNTFLKAELYKARMSITPEKYIAKTLKLSVLSGIMFAAMIFFYTSQSGSLGIIPLIVGLVAGYGTYIYFLQAPKLTAAKIAVDIDKEVLFAGRFLLVKLNSGVPLVNALIEASKSYGVANKYFLEIVRDIELGTSLEDAIEKAMVNSPSKHWRKVLFQIHNALELGIDVSQSLESVLDDISYDYLMQIQRYGKKLSTITLFYLLFAVVFPSLGMTIITVIIGFTNVQLTMGLFIAVLVVVLFIQVIFMRMFMSIRPKVNL